MHYYITLTPDDNDTLFASCPALPECNEMYWNARLGERVAARGGDALWSEIVGNRGG